MNEWQQVDAGSLVCVARPALQVGSKGPASTANSSGSHAAKQDCRTARRSPVDEEVGKDNGEEVNKSWEVDDSSKLSGKSERRKKGHYEVPVMLLVEVVEAVGRTASLLGRVRRYHYWSTTRAEEEQRNHRAQFAVVSVVHLTPIYTVVEALPPIGVRLALIL
jgi:hypothetical protein